MSNYGHLPQQIAAPVGAFPVGTPMHMLPAMYLQYGQGQAAPSTAPAPGAHLPQALSAPQLAGGLMPPPPPQQLPQHISQQMGVPQQLPQHISQQMGVPQQLPQQMPPGMPQQLSQQMPQGVPPGAPQQLPQDGQRQQHFQYAQQSQQRQHFSHPPPQSPHAQQPPHLQGHHPQHSPVLGPPRTPLPGPPPSATQAEAYQQHVQHGSPQSQSQQLPVRSPHNNSRSHMSPAGHTPQPHYSVQVPLPVKGYPGPPIAPQHKSQLSPHLQHQPSPHSQSRQTHSPHQPGAQQPFGPHAVPLPPGVPAYMPQQMMQVVAGGIPQIPQALQQRAQDAPQAQPLPPGSVPPPPHQMASSGVPHQGIPPPAAPHQWFPQAMSPGVPHSLQHPGVPPAAPQGGAQAAISAHPSLTPGTLPPPAASQSTQQQAPPPGYSYHRDANGYVRARSPGVSSQSAPHPQATPQPVSQGSPSGAPSQLPQTSTSQAASAPPPASQATSQKTAPQQSQRRHSTKQESQPQPQPQCRNPAKSPQTKAAAPAVPNGEEAQAPLQQTGDFGQRADVHPSSTRQASSPQCQGSQQEVPVPGPLPAGEKAEQSAKTPLVRELEQLTGETWADIGRLAEAMGQYPTGVQCLELALKYQVFSVPMMHSLASCYRQVGDFGSAIEAYRTVLQHQPDNGDAWAALGHCYLRGDDLPKSYQAHQQAFYHREGREPQFWYGLGILYDRYGSLEYAEEALIQVLKIDKHFDKATEVYFRLGLIYKQQNRLDLALKVFEYILNDPPTPLTVSDIWFQIGNVHEQRQAFTDACDAYEQVLKGDANHAKVLQQLGWLYHQQTKHETALKYLTRSLEADPSDSQSWYLLGRCYMSQTKYQRAYEAYQQAVYRDARNPTFWCSIGVLYYQISQYRDALDAYSRAIGLNPYISEAWYDLGMLYESCSNHTSDALYAYQRAARLDPENEQIKARIDHLKQQDQEESGSQQGNTPVQTAELPIAPPREPHVKISPHPPTASLNGAALLPESLKNMASSRDSNPPGQKTGEPALPVQSLQPLLEMTPNQAPQPVQPVYSAKDVTLESADRPDARSSALKYTPEATEPAQAEERPVKRRKVTSVEEARGEACVSMAPEPPTVLPAGSNVSEVAVGAESSESVPGAEEPVGQTPEASKLEVRNSDAHEHSTLQDRGDNESQVTVSKASPGQSNQNPGPVRHKSLANQIPELNKEDVVDKDPAEEEPEQAEVTKDQLKGSEAKEPLPEQLNGLASSTSQEPDTREQTNDVQMTENVERTEPNLPEDKASVSIAETAKADDKLAENESSAIENETEDTRESLADDIAPPPVVQPVCEKRPSTESPPPAKRQLVEDKGRDIDEDEDYD